jgi:hypothetical protein
MKIVDNAIRLEKLLGRGEYAKDLSVDRYYFKSSLQLINLTFSFISSIHKTKFKEA